MIKFLKFGIYFGTRSRNKLIFGITGLLEILKTSNKILSNKY